MATVVIFSFGLMQLSFGLQCVDFTGNVERRQALMEPGITDIITPNRDYDITGTGDNFGLHVKFDEGRFCYAEMEGDFSITVQVDGIEGEGGGEVLWGSAGGICVREAIDSGSVFYAVRVNHGNEGIPDRDPDNPDLSPRENNDSFYALWRMEYGLDRCWQESGCADWRNDPLSYINDAAQDFPDVWLRLDRNGHEFQSFFSSDGENWREVGNSTRTVEMPNKVYAGFFVIGGSKYIVGNKEKYLEESDDERLVERFNHWFDGVRATVRFRNLVAQPPFPEDPVMVLPRNINYRFHRTTSILRSVSGRHAWQKGIALVVDERGKLRLMNTP
jgi:hypothetical protein